MNILLVSVTERTSEIGLRKALGARSKDILFQFLAEAVFLTVFGGFIGVVGGIFLAFVLAHVVQMFLSTYQFAVSVPSVLLALIMAFVTGIVFGISPAKHAASLQPIESLRYE